MKFQLMIFLHIIKFIYCAVKMPTLCGDLLDINKNRYYIERYFVPHLIITREYQGIGQNPPRDLIDQAILLGKGLLEKQKTRDQACDFLKSASDSVSSLMSVMTLKVILKKIGVNIKGDYIENTVCHNIQLFNFLEVEDVLDILFEKKDEPLYHLCDILGVILSGKIDHELNKIKEEINDRFSNVLIDSTIKAFSVAPQVKERIEDVIDAAIDGFFEAWMYDEEPDLIAGLLL